MNESLTPSVVDLHASPSLLTTIGFPAQKKPLTTRQSEQINPPMHQVKRIQPNINPRNFH